MAGGVDQWRHFQQRTFNRFIWTGYGVNSTLGTLQLTVKPPNPPSIRIVLGMIFKNRVILIQAALSHLEKVVCGF